MPSHRFTHHPGTAPSRGAYRVRPGWRRILLRCFDAIGNRLWPRRPVPLAPLGSLLVLRCEHLGDLCISLPALDKLQASLPDVEITFAVRSPFVSWMEEKLAAPSRLPGGGAARRVLPLDPPWPRRNGERHGLRTGLRFLRQRRLLADTAADGRRFDLALELQGDLRTLLVARTLARRVAGSGIRGGEFLVDVPIPLPGVPIAARLDAATTVLLTALRRAATPGRVTASSATAEAWERRFVLVNPGTGEPSKRWPREHWVALLQRFAAAGLPVLLSGSAGEAAFCRELRAAVVAEMGEEAPLAVVAGQTSVPGLERLVRRARAVIAPDTGIIHLAQAQGTPSLALFGPTDPGVWGYDRPRHRSLAMRQACSYCQRRRCPVEPRRSPCLVAVTPDQLWRAWLALARECLGDAGALGMP